MEPAEDLVSLARRLDALEATNARLAHALALARRSARAWLVVAVAALATGALAGARPGPVTAQEPARELRASRIVLAGADGKERVVLSGDEEISVGASRESGPMLIFKDRRGAIREMTGILAEPRKPETGGVAFFGDEGQLRALFTESEEGAGELHLFEKDGKAKK